MAYKAVIYDLDGTLVRTSQLYRGQVVGPTVHGLGGQASVADIAAFWFEPNREKIIRERFKVDSGQFWIGFRKRDTIDFRKMHTQPYWDVVFLNELRAKGVKTSILTGAPQAIADLELSLIDSEIGCGNFEIVVFANGREVKHKPSPEGVEKCLDLMGSNKEETIYVGNGPEDIDTARNAEVFDVLINRKEYPYNGQEPSLIIKNLYELRPLFGIGAS